VKLYVEKRGKINGSFGGKKRRCSLKSFYFEVEELVSIVIFEVTFFKADFELLIGRFDIVEVGQ